ncbi:MAG: Planctomycete cytochrome, partial [Phycisphaerales bacterium]|nr:Planctomycete cytochrome [Phycisphaerales bacterium]
AQPASAAPPAADVEFFEARVRPLLAERCYKCHSARDGKDKGGLTVDALAGLLKGGDNGPSVVPGQPGKSKLIEAVSYANVDLQMPPKGKLTDGQVADLAEWVRRGAPWPGGPAAAPGAGKPVGDKPSAGGTVAAVAAKPGGFDLAARKSDHWAWRPMSAPPVPPVRDAAWATTDVDRFVLAKLEAAGLAPARAADRRALIRRAAVVLTGLPPAPADVEAFVADSSPDAFAKVVDRLLASPAFGEVWGRHWLDLVRYAETRGHEFDYDVPAAWRYRDYVVRALNADVPYDQFVTEHVAGDLLPRPRTDATGEVNESVLGTGFWFLNEQVHSPVDIRADECDRVDNQIDTFGKAFLGLTVGCARCHDHKFDAISAKDYAALAGFVYSGSYREVSFEHQASNAAAAARLQATDADAAAKLLAAVGTRARPVTDRLGDYLVAAIRLARGDAAFAPTADLDSNVIRAWADELRRSEKAAGHPLRGFATLMSPAASAPPPDRSKPPEPAATVVVDYAVPAAPWLADGDAFGTSPLPAGRALAGPSPDRPVAAVLDGPAAVANPHGKPLPGLLRTPTFTIPAAAPKLYLRVRGMGRAFVCIGSYRLAEGPLHQVAKQTLKAPDGWRVHAIDLTGYAGQRAHVEFGPDAGGAWLAVQWVRLGADAPANTADGRVGALAFAASDASNLGGASALGRRTDRSTPGDAGSSPTASVNGSPAAAPSALALPAPNDVPARAAGDRLREAWVAATNGTACACRDDAALADWLLARPALLGLVGRDGQSAGTGAADSAAAAFKNRSDALAAAAAGYRPSATAMAMLDGSPVDERVLVRGSHKTPGDVVPRRFLEAVDGDRPLAGTTAGSGRLALAGRLVDPANPLVARVMVNRVWHHLFGRGIVASTDNLGVMGDRPTHPELLDHLAAGFVADGWSVKRLVRRLVLTSAWQMDSRPPADAAGQAAELADPRNLLLHRANLRRLEAEAVRDAMLAVSGRLDPAVGGPSVEVYLTPFMDGRGRPKASGPLDGDGRRSLYTRVRRNFLSPMMLAFDAPQPAGAMGRRSVSNVPAQALILMNDPFVVQQAGRWAARVLAEPGRTPEQRIDAMYRAAYARPPTPAELAAAVGFLEGQGAQLGVAQAARRDDPHVWADLAHVLMNVKEFVYVP